MPKVALEPLPNHVVVPDTNILWDKDKKYPLSPEFDKFWDDNISLISLALHVPEVVLGELHFQQATSAVKLANSIIDYTAELADITNGKYESSIDQDKIRNQVDVKLKKWLKSHNGQIVDTPVKSIDWSKMVSDAIWRNEPFTFDPKDKNNEKGFRDALILESLISVCENKKLSKDNIVFLCNDFLLRTTAEKKLEGNAKVLFFESLTDFGAYIKLTQQKLTDKFVREIQTHAKSKFFTSQNKSTIYFNDKIKQIIQDKFSTELSIPNFVTSSKNLFGDNNYQWAITNEAWWIEATRFDELVAPREYHWISKVTIARLLSGKSNSGGLLASILTQKEEVHLQGFEIKWKANVKADGRFYSILVIDISKTDPTVQTPTAEAIIRWKLQK